MVQVGIQGHSTWCQRNAASPRPTIRLRPQIRIVPNRIESLCAIAHPPPARIRLQFRRRITALDLPA
jgi:hypothetical protein